MPSLTAVGIDAIGLAFPARYLELEALARARGVEPTKFTVGLGCKRMSVADPSEDSVALGASAARRVLDQAGLDPARIGFLAVGTETGIDHSKPIASHIQGLLKLPSAMRVFDVQHACFGGTAALMAASDWLVASADPEQVALVICTDLARYGVKTPGEPTQGGGAVALLITRDPRLLAFDRGVNGSSSRDVYDFWRPLGRREAITDGHYSVQCYLEATAESFQAWRRRARARDLIGAETRASDELARIVVHTPYPKMARKAYAHLLRSELPADLTPAQLEEADRASAARFDEQVAPTLWLPSEVGNCYTASLYLGLASLLHLQGAALANQRIGLFSYGSGCASEFFSGVVQPTAAKVIAGAGIDALLAARRSIDVEEYERLMGLPANEEFAAGASALPYRYRGVAADKRRYSAD